MKTRHLSIIAISVVLMLVIGPVFSYGQMSTDYGGRFLKTNEIPTPQNPPLIISQVELYGPYTLHNYSCMGIGSFSVHQWFELYNPTSYSVHIKGYVLDINSKSGFGGTQISSEEQIDLEPHQKCVFGLFAVEQDYIPDPRNVVVSFDYNYSSDKYKMTTPPLTDTYNDTRTWNLSGSNWIFSAPPPLKQLASGITPENVVCNKDLNLMLLENKTICVSLDHVSKMKSYGWSVHEKPEYIPVLSRTYDSGPGFGCPFIFPHLSLNDSSGFEKQYNSSGIIHYILKAGKTGTITYVMYGDSYGLDPPIFSPAKYNVTNGANIFLKSQNQFLLTSTPDFNLEFEPNYELVNNNGYSTVTAKFVSTQNTLPNTYSVEFVPGGCSEIPVIALEVEK